MAAPSFTETLNTFIASTAENRRPGLVDNVYGSAPMLAYLRKNQNVMLRGGSDIRENFIYAGFSGGSYGRGDSFNTSVTEFSTAMRFDWKFCYMPCNIFVQDIELNDSPEQTFDIVEAVMENAELSLIDDLSTQIFGDGSGNAGKDFDGLANGVAQSGTYGGITISNTSDTPGRGVRAGAEDSTGGTLSLANVNVQFGNCVVGNRKPDLLVTTQTLWNRFWERSQPSERVSPEEERGIGFEAVRMNGAYVTVDSHCPSGFLYLLNTNSWRMYLHNKWDFRLRGPLEPTNQQLSISQLIVYGNLVDRSPRLNGKVSGLS